MNEYVGINIKTKKKSTETSICAKTTLIHVHVGPETQKSEKEQ